MIFVSLDDTREIFEKALAKYNPPGSQVWAPGGFESTFAKFFDIRGIPTQILVDRDGNISAIKIGGFKESEIEEHLNP